MVKAATTQVKSESFSRNGRSETGGCSQLSSRGLSHRQQRLKGQTGLGRDYHIAAHAQSSFVTLRLMFRKPLVQWLLRERLPCFAMRFHRSTAVVLVTNNVSGQAKNYHNLNQTSTNESSIEMMFYD